MEVTYDYFRIFYYAATQGSFSRAASVLGINQPNVTKYMSTLEAQLETTLFIRTNRGVRLTAEGEKLLSHVTIAYEHLREAQWELKNDKNLQTGMVTIAASESTMRGVLLPALNSFHQLYPGIRLSVATSTTPQALRTLYNKRADFALIVTPAEVSAHCSEVVLQTFHECLIAQKGGTTGKQPPMTPKEILTYPLVGLGKDSVTYMYYSRYFAQMGLVWNVDIEATNADQLVTLIENGLGIGFVPDFLIQEALLEDKVVVLPFTHALPSRQIVLVQEKGRPLSYAALALIETIRGTRGAQGTSGCYKSRTD